MPHLKFFLLFFAFLLLIFPKLTSGAWIHDKDAPTTIYTHTPNPCSATTRTCTFTFVSCTDSGGGTCQKTYTSFSPFTSSPTSGTARNPSVAQATFTETLPSTNNQTLYYRSVDDSGNVEPTKTLAINFSQPACISGYVFYDLDRDGVLDLPRETARSVVGSETNNISIRYTSQQNNSITGTVTTRDDGGTQSGYYQYCAPDSARTHTFTLNMTPPTTPTARFYATTAKDIGVALNGSSKTQNFGIANMIDGGWREEACSVAQCGGGVQYRRCDTPLPQFGGSACPAGSASEWPNKATVNGVQVEYRACNTNVCLSPWIQTTSGDVHSNLRIDAPGGP